MSDIQKIYNIRSGLPFLSTLADALLNDRLGDGGVNAGSENPFHLADTTIYLPTRRAVRSLRACFSRILGEQASLLPSMRTFGDEEEGELPAAMDGALSLAPAISPAHRQTRLAILVQRWVDLLTSETRQLYGDEDIVIPSSSAEAMKLAGELGNLIDQMRTEEIDWHALNEIVGDDYSQWWQLTLQFLKIPAAHWPQYLSDNGLEDQAGYRNRLLALRTERLILRKPNGLVIAAGSTGSIPATRRFIKAVSNLPNGRVILPGVDMNLDQAIWKELSDPKNDVEDHGQYGVAQLMATLNCTREELGQLGEYSQLVAPPTRGKLVSFSLLPSNHVDSWYCSLEKADTKSAAAFDQVTLIEAPAERQEACAIALVLRKQLEDPDKRAALITPDRTLARRVKAELLRFGISVDDSSGQPLANTSVNMLIMNLLSVCDGGAGGVEITGLLKHPLIDLSGEEFADRETSLLFERSFLRGHREVPKVGKFAQTVECRIANLNPDLTFGDDLLLIEHQNSLIALAKALDEWLGSFGGMLQHEDAQSLATLYAELRRVLVRVLIKVEEAQTNEFSDELEALIRFMDDLTTGASEDFLCRGSEFSAVHDALISGQTFRSGELTHPRLFILGPLEARLQEFDCVVLGGMNEGKWPAQYDSGPFLNRVMRRGIGLPTPERRIGLAAHDFEQFMGAPNVVLSRAQREENAPSVASRFIQRLYAVVGEETTQAMKHKGQYYLDLAAKLDEPKNVQKRALRPNPKPPISSRPQRLSVSDIELWIRDPYALYAKRILKLRPLSQMDEEADAMVRGTLLHDALARLVSEAKPTSKEALETRLSELITQEAVRLEIPDALMAQWGPRFEEIVTDFVSMEMARSSELAYSICEINGRLELADGFTISARADRIDVLKEDRQSVEILDYKTGENPTAAMGRTLSPQLPIEGLIASSGGFEGVDPVSVSQLKYVRLMAQGKLKADSLEVSGGKTPVSTSDILAITKKRLESLIHAYRDPEQGYVSRYAVMRAGQMDGDYDHLSRFAEWSWGDSEDDD